MLSLAARLREAKGREGGGKDRPACSKEGLPRTIGLSEPSRDMVARASSSRSRGGEGELVRGKMGSAPSMLCLRNERVEQAAGAALAELVGETRRLAKRG